MSVADAHASVTIKASRASRSQRLIASIAIGAIVAVFISFWPTTVSLIERWQDTVHRTYTHGHLVVAISAWLIWRDRLRLPPAVPFLPGVLPLVAGVVLWTVAWRAGLQIVHQSLLPLLVLLVVLASCGWAVTRQLLLPILYLYCAVPVWDALNPLLQWISVFAVRTLLLIADIPAYFEGNQFQLPAGSFEIADGCSGLHFFVVAFSISVLYGAINRDPLRMRVRLVVFALLLALLTNWLRIFVIVLAGHLTHMQHELIRGEHYSFGWFMFAGAMTVFFLVARRWPLAVVTPADLSGQLFGAVDLRIAFLALAVVAISPLWNVLDENRARDATAHFQANVQGWSAREPTSSWHPRFQGADQQQHVEYRSGEFRVESFVATYLSQEQGKELVGYGNSVLGELLEVRGGVAAAPPHWRAVRARDAAGAEWLVLYTYVVDRSRYSSAGGAQIAYGMRSLVTAPLSSVFVLRSRCERSCEDAQLALQRFTAAAGIS